MRPDQQQLFDANTDLAEQAAREVADKRGCLNGMTVEDYRQAALMGLWQAVQSYTPARGPLANYSRGFMRRRIFDEIRSCDEVGRSRRADGIRGASVSLENSAAPAGHGQRQMMLKDLIHAPRHADQVEAYSAVRRMLDGLDDRERIVVFLLDVMELAAWQAGDVLDLPEHFVQSLRQNALAQLRGSGLAMADAAEPAAVERRRKTVRRFADPGGPCGPLFCVRDASNN